ncbi:MAG: hypothetical protein H6621_10240 [Halobacteriovoraceae bacterium]|nr:hypothetical protein [Halobacteriovoraceae bacterium]MCB9095435.1 hypothetical protein [Halobacteriovoraceae bacterium]
MKKLIALILFTSCSVFDFQAIKDIRNDRLSQSDSGFMTPTEDFRVAIGDSGEVYKSRRELMNRVPNDSPEKKIFLESESVENELGFLENRMTNEEYEFYSMYSDKFESESERIYFLTLPSYEQKVEYLQIKGIVDNPVYNNTEKKLAVDYLEIVPGMSKDQVMAVMGNPRRVDYAGDPTDQNERWGYATTDQGVTRYIYFESGRVEGWEHATY